MLTISKPFSAAQAQSYHKKEFTSEQQSYWSRGSAVRGEWQGRLASKYGLTGAVSEDAFARLSQGQHPESAEQLVRHRLAHEYKDENGKTVTSMEHRAGWDATFSAVPASLKLIFVFDFDVSHHHGQFLFMDIDSRYPIGYRLPPGGSGERAGDYINLGLGLSPLPQREKQRTIHSLDHARSGSNLHSASASPLSFSISPSPRRCGLLLGSKRFSWSFAGRRP